MVLRLPDEAAAAETARVAVRLTDKQPTRPTAARAKVLAAAAADRALRGKSALAKEAGVSLSVVDGLIDDGVLEAVAVEPEPVAPPPTPISRGHRSRRPRPRRVTELVEPFPWLHPEAEAADNRPILLEGVTGSGKTEVYFEAVGGLHPHRAAGAILMPEIALTAQFPRPLRPALRGPAGAWHSGVGGKRRERLRAAVAAVRRWWWSAPSALFLPLCPPRPDRGR